mmetsp:Transcript_28931/g.60997  ORF Transcript_28931/g.60997 Transcript_28931/m.60997 type:complete len:498 (-) Transcript_28931:16-1509(-)
MAGGKKGGGADGFQAMFDSDTSDEEDLGPAPSRQEEAAKASGTEAAPAKAADKEAAAEGDADDEEQKKRQQFEAMFDSDSDDEDFGPGDDGDDGEKEKDGATKKRLADLAKSVKKGQKGKASGGKKGQKGTKRQRDAEKAKEKAAKDKSAKKAKKAGEGEDGGALWDLMDSEDDGEGTADATDKAFIDDDGADLFDSSGDEGEGDAARHPAPQAEEAEEADEEDEVEARLKKRKARGRKRKEMDPAEKAHICRSILSRMEAAFDADNEALKGEQPAIHKLKLLGEVESIFSLRHMHETLLYEGCLNVLKSWLSPLPDWTLPNVKIRATLLRVLQLMKIRPVDDKLDKLKSSGIGKVVMFLYKVSDETPDNKRLCGEIIQEWSRPIFAQNDSYASNRLPDDIRENRTIRKKKKKKKKVRADGEAVDEVQKPIHRNRLRMPEPSQMDFKVQPASRVDFDKAKKIQSPEGSAERRYKAKFGKKKPPAAGGTKMSIEGRGM